MKKILLLLVLTSVFNCQKTKEEATIPFYAGTYTEKDSKGIYKFELDGKGQIKQIGLVAETTNSNYIAISSDHKTLFAVGEKNANRIGLIKSYKITKDSLELISTEESGGAEPCFVAVNNENYILVANYKSGNVGLLKADSSGKLSTVLNVEQHFGKGIAKRQKSPHAHSTWFHPNKKEVISIDFGTNQLWFSILDRKNDSLILTEQKNLKMADGAGPRHLTFHPNNKWIYVLNELNNTVSMVKQKNEVYEVNFSITTLPKDFTGKSGAGDIVISKDGKFLYASNRGHDSIVIYEVNPENGSLKAIGYEPTLGERPRNISLSPDDKYLVVANKQADNIVSFKRNAKSGKLSFVSKVVAPMPACIVF